MGIGVAVAARWIARQEIEAGQLVAVPMPKGKLKRRWVASALKGRTLNLPERTFVGLARKSGDASSDDDMPPVFQTLWSLVLI